MYSSSDLIRDRLPALSDARMQDFQSRMQTGAAWSGHDAYKEFLHQAPDYLAASALIQIKNLDQLPYHDVIMGCNHFIDALIMQHGIRGLQIFEHDYRYYQRLAPDIAWARPGQLRSDRPVVIAAPFPGALDLHWQWDDIMRECEEKNIDVHIDGAWMGAARDVCIDVASPSIKSLALSMSKGQGLGWNRIGIRWQRRAGQDSVTIFNQSGMLADAVLRVALSCMHEFDRDYAWNMHHQQYHDICRQLRLRPSKIIHAALSLDRRELYGLAGFFRA